ncbi:alpha-l-rhamnosidase [Xylariales sp. AK1849]|nr:alpha-l-rhamnosidase [Xylariales sp. AK1849]
MASSTATATAVKNLADAVFSAKPADGPWQKYNLAPESRTLFPQSVYASEGEVTNAESILSNGENGSAILSGKDALLTVDFGVNTAGMITLIFGPGSTKSQSVSLAFTESKLFVGRTSDRSMDFFVEDGVLTVPVDGQGQWTCPEPQMRGAFRYLTIFMDTAGTVEIQGVSTYNNMMPSWQDDLRQYAGFFYSNDDFLNTIWYAGAYTLQIATIPTHTGRRSDWVHKKVGWANDVPSAPASFVEVLTDGARRDRSVWSGDRGISELTNFVALNNKDAVIAGVDWMFEQQTDEGAFPYAAKPIWHYGSDSYHLWTFVALYNAYFFDGSGNAKDWVRSKWDNLKRGMEFSLAKIDETGLFKVDMPLDWGRHILKGHNLEVNCILYFSLKKGAELAKEVMGDTSLAEEWLLKAAEVKQALNKHLWNATEGMYTDFIGSDILAQDGNSLAIWYGLPDSEEKVQSVSAGLPRNWNEFGAVAPESPGMISVFCSSMELIAHFEAKQPERAMQLLRTMWGYIWNSPYSVQSSLIEGYFHDGRCHYPFTDYDPAYISHAHPWASGPTIVLTFYVVGLRLLNAEHTEWIFEPQPGVADHLEFAISGVTSNARGFISAGWKFAVQGHFEMAIAAPEGTTGTIGVPKLGKEVSQIKLNGEAIPLQGLAEDKHHLYVKGVRGGNHEIHVTHQ